MTPVTWLSAPGVRKAWSKLCVHCGREAEFACARCGVTPYCSDHCQRLDWARRHSGVCHNLAVSSSVSQPAPARSNVVESAPKAPLRRPHSPANNRMDNRRQDGDSVGYNRRGIGDKRSDHHAGINNRRPDTNNHGGSSLRRDGSQNNRNYGQNASGRTNNYNHQKNQEGNANRRQLARGNDDDDENWGKPAEEPKPVQQQKNEAKNEPIAEAKSIEMPRFQTKSANGTSGVKKIETAVKSLEKPLVPAKCLIELLEIGTTLVLSVDSDSSTCKDNRPGFICLSMTEAYHDGFSALCEPYTEDCERAVDCKPKPGETFSLYLQDESAYYRARCLTTLTAALLDASKVVPIPEGAKCKALPDKYAAIAEYCCLIVDADVKVGDRLQCTITSKDATSCMVDVTNDKKSLTGRLMRWKPQVEYPVVKEVTPVASSSAGLKTEGNDPPVPNTVIPTVPRPCLTHKSSVVVLEVAENGRMTLRVGEQKVQQRFDDTEQKVALYGTKATPLKEPPVSGEVVLAKYSDGIHYRALCRRTNHKLNKYLLEYIEYGNEEIAPLETLYPCPEEYNLDNRPAITSIINLFDVDFTLTPAALEYAETLKEGVALTLTLPNGEESAPSGSDAILTVTSKNENVNKKLKELSKPEWKKLEENGKDVFSSEVLMLKDLTYLTLPTSSCKFAIVDSSLLEVGGMLSVIQQDNAHIQHMEYVLGALTDKMNEYCNSELGRDPYLPRDEELCIAKCPPFDQWFRAIKLETPGGPGSIESELLYFDYGNMSRVKNTDIRKMLPEFVKDLPAACLSVYIKDFPQSPSKAAMKKAREYLQIDEENGGGNFTAKSCSHYEPGSYNVSCPELIDAMKGL